MTDGDSGTPMEKVEEAGTAEDASITVPPSFRLSTFPGIEGSWLYTT